MTADVPRQQAKQDKDIDTVRNLISQGVIGEYQGEHRNPRWPELCTAAEALGVSPATAIYRTRNNLWTTHHTVADEIREAATR